MRLSIRRYLGLFSLIAVLVLAACEAEDVPTPEVTEPETAEEATPDNGTPVATPDDGTPVIIPGDGTPVATPDDGTPVAGTDDVDLQTALDNLIAQDAFEMLITMDNLPGAIAVLLGFEYQDSATMIFRHDGDDRHVEVIDQDGVVIAQVWRVDDTGYVDIGQGPMEVSEDDPLLGQALQLVDSHIQLLTILEDTDVNYTVTGTEEVGDVETTVAEATYLVSNLGESVFLPEGEATVDSTIWVAQDEQYLVQAALDVQPEGEEATEPVMIEIDVRDVGGPVLIEAPIGS